MGATQALKDLRRKFDEQYKKGCEAIDIVIAISEKIEGDEPLFNIKPNEVAKITTQTDAPSINEDQNGQNEQTEVLSVRDAIRGAYPSFPEVFKRANLIDSTKREYPEFADKLTNAAVDSSIRKLVEEEVIEVQRKGAGRVKPAIYRKLKESAEKPQSADDYFAVREDESGMRTG